MLLTRITSFYWGTQIHILVTMHVLNFIYFQDWKIGGNKKETIFHVKIKGK